VTKPRSHALAAAGVFLLTLLTAAPARAQQRYSDVVVLTNGNRITGEIKSLSRGRLSFDVKPVGVISINWAYVAELKSDYLFEIETNEGAQILGTLGPAGPGKLAIVTTADRWVFEHEAVVSIAPIYGSFLRRLDGSVNLGGSYTQSSGVAQLSFAVDVKARKPLWEWRVSVDENVTFEAAGPTTERFSAGVGYSRDVTRHWALFAGGQVERNPDLGFNFRGTLGGGVERTLLRSNKSSMVVGAGLGASREAPVDGENQTLLPGVLTFRHSFFTYSTPKTGLDTTLTVLPILNQAGRWRLEANTSVSREIVKNFTVALTLYESYDNRPPTAEANRNDAGATLSVGFTF
jgi:hypothetical protein